ncbi:sigma-70 family RNA polymerase sigma factor (plasmid) [Clostridium perfringens]|uniref:sigma-70 family RNA polymerase sigma factor n=1 Tax=Clostridium perfringens TaxID=1502 RepID=UPI000B382B22|nr:sigma-70 family RNA polymerase sigma factor [Clostridium perfringens]EGT0690188.1 sigma-70 family RNA polymerase sigma factor [Clostridium perfringens]EGT0693822.1 sigma-70 family RNA polymerase sigma factor [Clostridium perfringens]EGT0696709.1 sigma-70 family RNA polymerase sigma factor [Clostridium perfringens]MDU3376289.1 sigma-70 family RNA polymerase sigma factor [Clostridium perfringens]MDU3536251.1 sigma-70 family RNA polymerase sigma factor [Clostridium perfringens]
MSNIEKIIIKAQDGDKECLGELINHYDGYIRKFIKLFNLTTVQEDEVYNSAIIGLMTALDKFNVSRGIKLNTYATGFIKKEIIDFIKKEVIPSNSVIFDKKTNSEIQMLSLDASIEMDNSKSSRSFNETLGEENCSVEDRVFLDEILDTFKEKNWIKAMYFDGATISEIAKREGVSESFIYRKKREIFECIRREVSINDIKIFN